MWTSFSPKEGLFSNGDPLQETMSFQLLPTHSLKISTQRITTWKTILLHKVRVSGRLISDPLSSAAVLVIIVEISLVLWYRFRGNSKSQKLIVEF